MQRTITGLRIRERRKELGLKQSELASRVGVSPSYLNLIEANKRGIGGALLGAIGREIGLSLDQLDGSVERRLREQLVDMATNPATGDPSASPDEADILIARHPVYARAAANAWRRLGDAEAEAEALGDRLSHDPALSAAIHQMLTELAALRSTSEILAGSETVPEPQRRRFETNMFQQISSLAETGAGLAAYFDEASEIRRRRTPHIDAEEAIAAIPDLGARLETLAKDIPRQIGARGEDVAHMLARVTPLPSLPPEAGLQERRDALALAFARSRAGLPFDTLIEAGLAADPSARSDETIALMREEIARRFADALLFPAERALRLGASLGWEAEAMRRAADGDTALAFRRIASLEDLGAPRAAHVTLDASGRTLARRGALELTPRSRSFDCPTWPGHRARPGAALNAALMLPEDQGVFALGWGWPNGLGAEMLIIDNTSVDKTAYAAAAGAAPTLAGPDCRICAHGRCPLRREASILSTAPPKAPARS